jgi:hypothetical protein
MIELLCKRIKLWRLAAVLSLLAAGCGDNGRAAKPGACAECAQRAAQTVAAQNAQNADPLSYDALALLMDQANEALFADEPAAALIPPVQFAETAETNQTDAIRIQMRDNAKELFRYMRIRNDYEARLRADDPEIRGLWQTLQTAQAEYNKRFAEKISGTVVPGRITQYTHRQKALSEQLRKLEEIQ